MSNSSSQLKWKIAKAAFYVNRFRTLPRADRVFRDVKAGTILERPLFGYKYLCDVSRAGPQKLIYLVGERFIFEADLVRSLLSPGMTVVDVGANVGYYALMFAQMIGAKGRIIAIEPSPENLPELELNIRRNKLCNTKIISKAVGSTKQSIGLRCGINSGIARDDRPAFDVEQDLIDNIITERIDFIKMDIEGYEGFAIEGAHRVLSEYRPTAFIEIHPSEVKLYGSSVGFIFDRLSHVYNHISVYEQKELSQLYEKTLVYYAGMSPIQRIANTTAYIDLCETGKVQKPFWIVCKN